MRVRPADTSARISQDTVLGLRSEKLPGTPERRAESKVRSQEGGQTICGCGQRIVKPNRGPTSPRCIDCREEYDRHRRRVAELARYYAKKGKQ